MTECSRGMVKTVVLEMDEAGCVGSFFLNVCGVCCLVCVWCEAGAKQDFCLFW